jgi:pimeloyl-ACP methyl ester carboxylesterase
VVVDDGGVISVNGVDLFVRRFGDPALPMLAVVHGGPTWDHTYLLPAVAELADSERDSGVDDCLSGLSGRA